MFRWIDRHWVLNLIITWPAIAKTEQAAKLESCNTCEDTCPKPSFFNQLLSLQVRKGLSLVLKFWAYGYYAWTNPLQRFSEVTDQLGMAIFSVTLENPLLWAFLMEFFNLGIAKMSVTPENPLFPNPVLPKTSVYVIEKETKEPKKLNNKKKKWVMYEYSKNVKGRFPTKIRITTWTKAEICAYVSSLAFHNLMYSTVQ